MKDSQIKDIRWAIRTVWDSLESHLAYATDDDLKFTSKKERLYGGDRQHHFKCIKEYARIINILSDLLPKK